MGDRHERGPLTRRRRTTISDTASTVSTKQANGSKPGNAGETSSVNNGSPVKVRDTSSTPRKDKSYDAIKERLR